MMISGFRRDCHRHFAILAILYKEPEFDPFVRILMEVDGSFMSAVSYFEASLVLIGRGTPEAIKELDALLVRVGIDVPFDHELATQATDAVIRFGKGRHPARLNLGDWASYALAQARRIPLLYKGDDFARTDVISAVRPTD